MGPPDCFDWYRHHLHGLHRFFWGVVYHPAPACAIALLAVRTAFPAKTSRKRTGTGCSMNFKVLILNNFVLNAWLVWILAEDLKNLEYSCG
ncbi:MAG: hypothetical protein H7833_11475 [Magnetococcus sp. DMHC-1]|nr:hypothetical protein [Magnetococcales bacterium]